MKFYNILKYVFAVGLVLTLAFAFVTHESDSQQTQQPVVQQSGSKFNF